jgi:hypothetical protein
VGFFDTESLKVGCEIGLFPGFTCKDMSFGNSYHSCLPLQCSNIGVHVRQQESYQKHNLPSNLLRWHLQTDQQTVALFISKVAALHELVRISTHGVPVTRIVEILETLVAEHQRARLPLRVSNHEEFECDCYLAFSIRGLSECICWDHEG